MNWKYGLRDCPSLHVTWHDGPHDGKRLTTSLWTSPSPNRVLKNAEYCAKIRLLWHDTLSTQVSMPTDLATPKKYRANCANGQTRIKGREATSKVNSGQSVLTTFQEQLMRRIRINDSHTYRAGTCPWLALRVMSARMICSPSVCSTVRTLASASAVAKESGLR
jgi:hypothetical protein